MWKTVEKPEPHKWSMIQFEDGEHAYGYADEFGGWWRSPLEPIAKSIKRYKEDNRQTVQVPVNWHPGNIFKYKDNPIIENDTHAIMIGTDGRGRWYIKDLINKKYLMQDEIDVLSICYFLNRYSFGVRHVK